MSRESEAVAYLRADPTLATLAPGGIYSHIVLGDEGVTDADTTPDVWSGGAFQTTVIVRQRLPVPTGLFTHFKSQVSDNRQMLEMWALSRDEDAIEAALERIYALVQGYALPGAWQSLWVAGGAPVMQAPELPTGIKQASAWYEVRSLRRPV